MSTAYGGTVVYLDTRDLRTPSKWPNPYDQRIHPMNNADNHQKLAEHIKERLDYANQVRNPLCDRFEVIDRNLAGYVDLKANDRQRDLENRRGKARKPIDVLLPLTWQQLDGIITYLLEVFAPAEGMFEAVARPDQEAIAKGFAELMNQHANDRGYYRQLAVFFLNCMRYNLGGLRVEWMQEIGNELKTTASGAIERNTGIIWEGNELTATDMYNTLWDTSVHPVDVPLKGEFVIEVDAVTKFRLNRMAMNGEIYDPERFWNLDSSQFSWYRVPPTIRYDQPGNANLDWRAILSANTKSPVRPSQELIYYNGWLNSKEFGLSDVDDMEMWRITMSGGGYITATDQINNSHGMLPVVFGQPFEDTLGMQQKSAAEIIDPLQTFGSFLLNVHQKSTRKSLFGITLYDKNYINLDDIPEDDVAARIPFSKSMQGKRIDEIFANLTDNPVDTSRTMVDLANVLDLIQLILPAANPQQVADLERATTYQAAATVQGSNKRSHKYALTINSQAFTKVETIMIMNIYEFQQPVEIITPNGDVVEVNASQFRERGIRFAVGLGLKGLDRLSVLTMMKELITVILQSPQASAEIDIVGLLNYFTSMAGDVMNLNQFRRPPAQTQIPPAE